MPPNNNITTRSRILKAIADYPKNHNGHMPHAWQIAVVTGLHTTTVQFALNHLQQDGKITITENRAAVVPNAPPTAPAGTDSGNINPADHEPPSERAAAHYLQASLQHLGTIEHQRREMDALRAELKAVKLAGGWERRHDIQTADLKAENARLRSELQASSDAWLSYQRRVYVLEAEKAQIQQNLDRTLRDLDRAQFENRLLKATTNIFRHISARTLVPVQLKPIKALM